MKCLIGSLLSIPISLLARLVSLATGQKFDEVNFRYSSWVAAKLKLYC